MLPLLGGSGSGSGSGSGGSKHDDAQVSTSEVLLEPYS